MASLPPRAPFTASPHLRTPDTDNNKNALALVPITTKDASPAAGAYPNNRSPLTSLGTNNLGLGIRQRRQQNSPFFNSESTIKGPPKASLTMSMGGSVGSSGMSVAKPSSVKNDMTTQLVSYRPEQSCTWILVWGFVNKDQCGDVLRKFKAIGNVTDVKMASGNKNWVALRYDNGITVEKAASEGRFQLSDGFIVGVHKLPDAHGFFLEQQRMYSTVLSHNLNGDSIQDSIQLFPSGTKDKTTSLEESVAEINEADILIGNAEKEPARGKPCCESVMAWIYGW